MMDGRSHEALKSVSWVGTREWKQDKSTFSSGSCLVYFKAFVYAQRGSRCVLSISANNRYKLWVNGRRISEGPCKGDRYRQFFDAVDISEFLIEGVNVIAAEVLYYSPAKYGDGNKTGPLSVVSNTFGPMLAVGGTVTASDGSSVDISTGRYQWRYLIDSAIDWEVFREGGLFIPVGAFEAVDGSLLSRGWRTDCCTGEGWGTTVHYYDADGSGWGEFPPLPAQMRPIAMMTHGNRGFVKVMASSVPGLSSENECIEIPTYASFFVEYDAGELCTGYPNLMIKSGRGAAVKITYAESYSADGGKYRLKGRRDDNRAYQFFGCSDTYLASGLEDRYEPFWWRTFRFVRLDVQTADESLTLFRPHFIETGYPLEELSSVSSEECSWLAPLWRTSVRTLALCMHETHEDCPYYEQMQYALDTRLQILFTYALGSDTRLARKAIEDFHSTLTPEGLLYSRAPTDEPNIVPVFSLYWIMMLEDYYIQTADIEFINFFRPTIDAILSWFGRRIGDKGLVEALYYWEFIDWVEDWQNENGNLTAIPDSALAGPCATTNLILAAALDSAARLLSHTRKETAAEYTARAEDIRQNVERFFWDETKGLYREGGAVGEYTQHAQAFAVLSGLASGERAARILNNAVSLQGVKECTYVFSFFLFRALEKAGLYHLTQGLWGKWTDALELGLTTWPEDLTRQRSDCHAWGSLPIYEFVHCFLGVQADEPGYAGIRIKPVCTYIGSMEGTASTPKGNVHVKWYNDGNALHIEGEAPAGVPTKVCGPYGGEVMLAEGGAFRLAFQAHRQPFE